MTGHQWSRPVCTAFAKSRGRPCQRRVGKRPDGSPHVVCDSHGAKTPPYEERPISAAGKQRIAETQRSRWAQYRADKAALAYPTSADALDGLLSQSQRQGLRHRRSSDALERSQN
jgi:hypothetical protein